MTVLTGEAGPPDRQRASPVDIWYEDPCPGGGTSS